MLLFWRALLGPAAPRNGSAPRLADAHGWYEGCSIGDMRSSMSVMVASVALSLALTTIGTVEAADAGAACRDHRAALVAARAALAEGKRDAALAALLQAKELLTRCRREEARHTTLLAATEHASLRF